MTVVGPVWSAVTVVSLRKNKDVVAATEGILEDRSRAEIDIGVIPGRLIGRGSIKVPDAELTNVGDLLGDSLRGMSERKKRFQEGTKHTVVLERRPLSPSIQTSGEI